MTEPDGWSLLSGAWIEIRYKENGRLESAYVMTDSQGRFMWQPPVGITEAYFRTTDGTTNGNVILAGADGIVPLWTSTDIAKFDPVPLVDCVVKGRVLCASIVRQLTVAFKYEMLPPDEHFLKMLDEEEVKPDFAKMRARLEQMQTEGKSKQPRRNWLSRVLQRKRKASF